MSPEYTRDAEVIPVRMGTRFRVRAFRFPETVGWYGGRFLHTHDQPTREQAQAIADRWVREGKLPEGAHPDHARTAEETSTP